MDLRYSSIPITIPADSKFAHAETFAELFTRRWTEYVKGMHWGWDQMSVIAKRQAGYRRYRRRYERIRRALQ